MKSQKNINIAKLNEDSFINSLIEEYKLSPYNKNTIIITGPTAIGKSGLALSLAQKLDGVIINADSLQVYKDLRILSARPSEQDEKITPHKLYGFMNIDETCSAALWLEKAKEEIAKTHKDGKVAIIVGGTGMYIRTLYQGIAEITDVPHEIKEESETLIKQIGNKAFFENLCALDPKVVTKLHPNDTQRILRAYNVVKHTGKSLFDFHNPESPEDDNNGNKQMIVMLPQEKSELLEISAKRFDKMIESHGAIDEVKELVNIISLIKKQGKAINPIITKAIGVQQIMDYLDNKITLDQAKDLAKIATNQ